MNITKLQISPIFNYPGISKKTCTINMRNISGDTAGEYIKQRLYLKSETPTALKAQDKTKVWDNALANIAAQKRYSQAINEIDTKLSLYR